eukprot:1153412-Pelagomonas_calceolata.AAC.8
MWLDGIIWTTAYIRDPNLWVLWLSSIRYAPLQCSQQERPCVQGHRTIGILTQAEAVEIMSRANSELSEIRLSVSATPFSLVV